MMTHLVDDGPGVFLGDGGGEAPEDLLQSETLLSIQVTSSPGRWGRGPSRVSRHHGYSLLLILLDGFSLLLTLLDSDDVTGCLTNQVACHCSNGNVPT